MSAAEVVIASDPTGADAPKVEQNARPDHIPEKFWDAAKGAVNTEALLQSYTALESKLGAPKDEPKAEEQKADEPKDEGDKQAEEALSNAGLNMAEFEAEFTEKGELSEASYEKLAKAGIDKSIVDEFVEYRKGRADAVKGEYMAIVGGEAEFERMVDWASKNWTPDQAKEYNDAVNSGQKGRVEIALKALKADFVKANGQAPNLLKATTGAPGSGDRYESMAQLMADQRKPEYRNDPAFRQKVMEKLARSSLA